MPKAWNWADVGGENLITVLRNQHIPTYCGSCWAHGPSSSIGDRILIQRWRQKQSRSPEPMVSVQHVVNKAPAFGCHGGSGTSMYSMAYKHGVVGESAHPYTATDEPQQGDGKDKYPYGAWDAYTCFPKAGVMNGTTDPIPSDCMEVNLNAPNVTFAEVYRVSEYGGVHGLEKIAAEIYARGPVSAGISANQDLEDFDGKGIFSQFSPLAGINHEVAVIGYDLSSSKKEDHYLIMRNSWGSYWADNGFAKVSASASHNRGLTREITWGVPIDPVNPDAMTSLDVLLMQKGQAPVGSYEHVKK